MEIALPVVWAILIAIAVGFYVILDGFDLGIGILFPFARTEQDRDQMMNSVAPFWDGNETWLILGGNGLLVAFPLAYSIILPALYIPVILMLLALVFRGVAFEFRWVSKPNHQYWDWAFIGGSIVAAFAQGLILGTLMQGVRHRDGIYVGGGFDWLTPFAVMCGAALVAGYALLGATWLVMKTDGHVEARARRQAKILLLVVGAFAALVSVWTPLAYERIAERWFKASNFLWLWPIPVITALIGYMVWRALEQGRTYRPFFGAIALFLLSYLGLAISNFPLIAPPDLTIWNTAAVPGSQLFSLVGALIALPLILFYTALVYWIFRGKVTSTGGYH